MDPQGTRKGKKKVANFVVDFGIQLGKGQFGQVYQAINQETNEHVAVKMIEKKQIYDDEYTKNALIREIQIMKNLKSPNIIRFVDIQQTANNIYIFQELASGGTLATLLHNTPNRRFEEKIAVEYAYQILNGFKQLINHGIIHRDIKLTNILMKDNVCKIADFGMSKYSGKLSTLTSVVGTPIYMAPQILDYYDEKSKYTYKCDIWSLGIVFFELVTGVYPWKNIMQCQMKQLLAKIKEQSKSGIDFPKNVKVSQQYKDLVQSCLKFDEQERINWNQLFKHKVFEGRFQEANSSNYQNFTLTQLRMKVHCNNVNLQKLIAKLPENLTKQDHFNLLRILDDQISQKQAENLFKLIAKQGKTTAKKNVLQHLQNHGIKLKGIKPKICEKQKNIQQYLDKMAKKIEQKGIDLFDLFKKFDTKKSNMLSKQQFIALIKSINSEFSNQAMEELFIFFKTDKHKGIKFQQFYQKLCKAVQIPAVKDQLVSKEMKKMEERNKT